MKTLYLMRHAKSSWSFDNLTDKERPLNTRGRDDAPAMGQALAERGITLDLVVTSPAVRALSTAALVAKEVAYAPEKIQVVDRIYEAEVMDLLDVVRQLPNEAASVLLVGHNNTLTEFANVLSSNPVPEMSTAAIACLQFACEQWADVNRTNSELYFYDHPRHEN